VDASDFIQRYDRLILDPLMAEYYGHSGFFNVGYWPRSTSTQADASEKLVAELSSRMTPAPGRILDAACGLGATTQDLNRRYPQARVIGINVSASQLRRCGDASPNLAFMLMDATRLAFPDGAFDDVLCVEAAFHFNTRETFLREAWRVLKPRGRLVLSDILFASTDKVGAWMVPEANGVTDIASYTALYARAGFEDVRVCDATGQCWSAYCRHVIAWIRRRFDAHLIDERTFHTYTVRFQGLLESALGHYLWVSATRPSL
jgi:ubiquinone/menaquinone biosynthesis C-methylase UbiE